MERKVSSTKTQLDLAVIRLMGNMVVTYLGIKNISERPSFFE